MIWLQSKDLDNSITSSKIQDGQVATSDVANGAITSNKLDSNSVNTVCTPQGLCTSKLADNAVIPSKIAPGAVKPQVTPRFGSVTTISAGASFYGSGRCELDELTIGGGYNSSQLVSIYLIRLYLPSLLSPAHNDFHYLYR
jgi:hypothetical protein